MTDSHSRSAAAARVSVVTLLSSVLTRFASAVICRWSCAGVGAAVAGLPAIAAAATNVTTTTAHRLIAPPSIE